MSMRRLYVQIARGEEIARPVHLCFAQDYKSHLNYASVYTRWFRTPVREARALQPAAAKSPLDVISLAGPFCQSLRSNRLDAHGVMLVTEDLHCGHTRAPGGDNAQMLRQTCLVLLHLAQSQRFFAQRTRKA
eukprot:6210733-Pleurochrysis_carterae.AAC.3